MKDNEFLKKLLYRVLHDCYEFQNNNIDFCRFQASMRGQVTRQLKDRFYLLLASKGYVGRHFSIEKASDYLAYILTHADEFENFYQLLSDEYSCQLLIDLLAYKVIGPQHVKLPINSKEYWKKRKSIDNDFLKERHTIKTQVWPGVLNQYQFNGRKGIINIHSVSLGILSIFVYEHYAYKRNGKTIEAEPGDVVLDAGSCWGDSALYFADRVGPKGKIYCFEFVLENLNILQKNLDLNRHTFDVISVVPVALWNKSGETLRYSDAGPGTSLEKKRGGQQLQVSTVSIDDFVRERRLKRVDFIKMDIEGSELKALQGGVDTIRNFRPKLAISLYHKKEDFVTIPKYLLDLDVKYDFFIDHTTIYQEETVLFARPGPD